MKVIFLQKEGSNIAQDMMEYNNIPMDKLQDNLENEDGTHYYTIVLKPGEIERITLDPERYRGKEEAGNLLVKIVIEESDNKDNEYLTSLAKRLHEQLVGHPDYIGYPDDRGTYICPIGLWYEDVIELTYAFMHTREILLPITIDINTDPKNYRYYGHYYTPRTISGDEKESEMESVAKKIKDRMETSSLIITMFKDGMSAEEIANFVDYSYEQICEIISSYKSE